jgi:hypothetical protein
LTFLNVLLAALLVGYLIFLCLAKPAAAAVTAALALSLFARGSPAGTIRVIDDATEHAVLCEIFREDSDAKRHRAGVTDRNGLYTVGEQGKAGEKYVAISEQYNPAAVECPVADAVIRVRKTIWLQDHLAKAQFLASAGAPAPAALEWRKASLIAEKHNDQQTFSQFEFLVVNNAAKVLGVETPFVETSTGLRPSPDLKASVRDYQVSSNLKPTGALNTDTLRKLTITPGPAEPSGNATRITARVIGPEKETRRQ